MSPCTMNWRLNDCIPRCITRLISLSISLTRCQKAAYLTEITFSMWWTLSTLITQPSSLGMQTSSGIQFPVRSRSCKPLRSLRVGWVNYRNSHSYHVSRLLSITLCAESKGRTLHLLKQRSKPVPQQRKRRKVEIFATPLEYIQS
jgi:hypothetical protein